MKVVPHRSKHELRVEGNFGRCFWRTRFEPVIRTCEMSRRVSLRLWKGLGVRRLETLWSHVLFSFPSPQKSRRRLSSLPRSLAIRSIGLAMSSTANRRLCRRYPSSTPPAPVASLTGATQTKKMLEETLRRKMSMGYRTQRSPSTPPPQPQHHSFPLLLSPRHPN